jgi:ubiquinol-cytochrome c reductase iron-sulfur subunit
MPADPAEPAAVMASDNGRLSRRAFSLACLCIAGTQCAGCHFVAKSPATPLYVDLREIAVGSSRLIESRSGPIVVRHRTPAEIAMARALDCGGCLPHPQLDSERTARPAWIILEARCTHLGCNLIEGGGRYGGWLCPCHGSEFDPSGRLTRGPADANLRIPPHQFVDEHTLVLPGLAK